VRHTCGGFGSPHEAHVPGGRRTVGGREGCGGAAVEGEGVQRKSTRQFMVSKGI
jgi:hypothetical protein